MASWTAFFKEFAENSSIHGIKYIMAPDTSMLGRMFWICAVCAGFWGTKALFEESLHVFEHHSISFTTDTAYLDWDSAFPAVSVCEAESPDKLFDRAEMLYGEDRDLDIDLYLRDVAFFSGTCYPCSSHCLPGLLDCPTHLRRIVQQFRSSCDELLVGCRWNDKPFDCCDWFKPLGTEIGTCFTLNSMLEPNVTASKELICNRRNGPGKLEFKALENMKLYIHGPEAVPYLNQPLDEQEMVYWGTNLQIGLDVIHMENDPNLESVDPEMRGCILQKENTLKAHVLYSYSGCVVECHAHAQIRLCNCTHHLIPEDLGNQTCDIKGLECLTKNSEELRSLRTAWYTEKAGLVCDCFSACTEPEFTIVWRNSTPNKDYDEEDYGSHITVQLDTLPIERFRRNVVKTRLDLVVSVGGGAGLFLGASLLSTVELVYFCIARFTRILSVKWCTIRDARQHHLPVTAHPRFKFTL